MKSLVLSLALFLSFPLLAEEIRLATITSDTVTDTTIFYLETNSDGSTQGLRYVTTNESGAITEDVHHRMDEVLDGGVVLRVMEGREIIRLFLEDFDALKGGTVKLRYLASGVTGSVGFFNLKLGKKSGRFALSTEKGEVINSLFIKGNWSRILRRWIGVSYIEATFESANQ